MKKNKIVILTTAFSQKRSYSEDYFSSLIAQSCKEFDVLLVDDGCTDLQVLCSSYPSLNILVYPGLGNIAKNRQLLINSAIDLGYEKAVFADFDDYFSANRVELSDRLLESADIVINELKLVDSERNPLGEQFAGFLQDQMILNLVDVLEANCFGMSNTAIRLSDAKKIQFDDQTKVVDWHYFSTLLVMGMKAVYSNQCWTFYRQHDRSMAHIRSASKEQLRNELLVKKHHYSLMIPHSSMYESPLEAVTEALADSIAFEEYFKQNSTKTSPFWWSLFNSQVYRKAKI